MHNTGLHIKDIARLPLANVDGRIVSVLFNNQSITLPLDILLSVGIIIISLLLLG